MSEKKEKALGVGADKGRYELPADRGPGMRFVVLLTGLMVFLAALAVVVAFSLSSATTRWSNGLANKMTVEILATDANDAVRPRADVSAATNKIAALLAQYPGVDAAHILTEAEVTALVKPWLGDDLPWADLPVPGLIAVTTKPDAAFDANILSQRVGSIDERARVEAHADWANDLLRLSRALQLASWGFLVLIGVLTSTAISGAVQARLAVNRQDVEVLHMMGAADRYIARQFQRQITRRVLQGGAGGLLAGVGTAFFLARLLRQSLPTLAPGTSPPVGMITALVLLPVLAIMIAYWTTGRTVYRNLGTLS